MTTRRTDGTLGPDFVVQGRLSGKSDSLRVEGALEGEVDVDAALTIGPGGRLHGDARVRDLEVEGEVRGDVSAAGGVVILAGGRVHGDVRARRVAIDDGGSLQGGIDMDFELPDLDDPAFDAGDRRR
jgi:cytoskeletal protein CcmA (bactofilin family)